MTILQQRIFKAQICFMTVLSSEFIPNSLSQFARLYGLAVMTKDF